VDQVSRAHTMTLLRTIKIDVWKLIEKSKGKLVKRRRISSIRHCGFSRRSGFRWDRYHDTDTGYPLIVTWDNFLIDGRHRLLKLKKQGRKTVRVIVMTNTEIDECKITRSKNA